MGKSKDTKLLVFIVLLLEKLKKKWECNDNLWFKVISDKHTFERFLINLVLLLYFLQISNGSLSDVYADNR